jgi:hypothetical protein
MWNSQFGRTNRSQALLRFHLDHPEISRSELARIFDMSIQRVDFLIKTNERKEWILRNKGLQSSGNR